MAASVCTVLLYDVQSTDLSCVCYTFSLLCVQRLIVNSLSTHDIWLIGCPSWLVSAGNLWGHLLVCATAASWNSLATCEDIYSFVPLLPHGTVCQILSRTLLCYCLVFWINFRHFSLILLLAHWACYRLHIVCTLLSDLLDVLTLLQRGTVPADVGGVWAFCSISLGHVTDASEGARVSRSV